MILFDYIINNSDRHRKNFGFLKSEKEFKMAPLFDHGLSLFSNFDENEIEEHGLGLLDYSEGKPFGDLGSSLRKYVSKDSLDNIRFDIESTELLKIIDFYAPILGAIRTNAMKNLVELRWNYVRKLFLKI
jgi:hypothetical protein